MDEKQLCEKVLELLPQVRFSGILNSRGDLAVGQQRPDSTKLLSPDEVKMSVHYTFQRWNSIQNLAHKIGNEKTNITEFDKVTLISLLLPNKNLLLLSSEPGANYMEIISKVKQIIPEE